LVSMKRHELQTSIWPLIPDLLLLRLYDYGCLAVGVAAAEPVRPGGGDVGWGRPTPARAAGPWPRIRA
jgi:hypothetical protein